MPTCIEQVEYEKPNWKEFSWVIQGQRVDGFESVLSGSTERLKRLRIAIPIPNDVQNVSLAVQQRMIIERDPVNPGRDSRENLVETYVISYWSPELKIGRLLIIPRELAQPLDEKGPIFVQVEQVDLCGYDLNRKTLLVNLP